MKRLIIYLTVFVVTFAIGVTVSVLRPIDKRLSSQARQADSYAVYSTVIKEFHNGDGRLVLIYDMTSSWPPYKEPPAELKIIRKAFPREEMAEILRDYGDQNLTSHSLTYKFTLTNRYTLLSYSGNYFATAETFFSRYRDSSGIIALSAVGFNSQMDHALVYVREYCIGDCGGAFFLLTKQDGVWTIAEQQLG